MRGDHDAPAGSATAGPPAPRHGSLRSLARWGHAIVAYPIPSLAAVGLVVGLTLAFPAGQGGLAGWVWLGTLLAGGIPLVIGTVRRLARHEFTADAIAAAAIVGAILLDQAFAGVVIVLMQGGGEALERYAFLRASASLEGLLRRAPHHAHRHTERGVEEIDADAVLPGDLLVVRSGDIVPVDGRVVSPTATLDESALTGEPLPRTRSAGERILSGGVNVGASFDLAAERPSRESQYAKIVALVAAAQTRKPAIQRLADRYAVWFTPLSFALAAVAALLTRDPLTALAVLVVATPCPLILATPIAVIGAVDRASELGLVVKSGSAMEEMGRARAVLFDKTGTLTSGRPEVERVVAFGGADPRELLRKAGALEQLSSHPLAQAVVRRARSEGVVLPRVELPHEFAGAGLSGTLDGHRILIGSRALAASESVRSLDAEAAELARGAPSTGQLASFLLVDGIPAGAIVFAERLRPEVRGLSARLRGLGVQYIALLTGDNRANAEEIGRQAEISHVEADLLPEAKVERVGAARRRFGSTIMVGDGINDAAALASASVGIAMGAQGAGVSAEAADAVLIVDDVSRVADGISLGQRMLRIARQGILFGLGASLVLMAIASFGAIAPALGAVLQEVIDVVVILNALRVR